MPSSATDFYVSCHCQANLLKLSIPATPKQLEPTLADADANSGTLADGASTDDDGWMEVSSASAWPEPEAAESVAGGAAEIDGKEDGDSEVETDTETAYAAATQALAISAPLIVCDCSICVKRLIIWSIQPADRITLIRGCEKGRGTMKSYSFGKKTWDHCFCGTCGTHVFSAKQGDTKELGINLRAVRQPLIDIYSLNPHQSHAASLAPAYQEAVLPEQTSAYLEARQKLYDLPTTVYTASCHCQAVVFGVVAKDLDEEEPFACMCSICAGNGNIWLPIGKYDLAFSNPSPSSSASNPCKPNHNLVTFYRFGPSRVNHVFCNTCGCQLYETIDGGDDDASFEGKRGERVDEMWTKVNVAAFEGAGRLLGDGTGKGWGKVKVKREMIELGAKYEIRL